MNPLAGRPTSPASHGAGSDDDPRDAADIAAAAVAAVAARRALAASGGSTELGLSASPIAVGDSTSRSSQGGDGRRSDHPLSNTMSSMQRFDCILAKRSAKDVLSGEVGDTTGADSGSDSSDDGGGTTPRAVGATSGPRLITRRSSKSVSSILSGISEAQRREQRRKLLAKANQLAGVDEATQGGAVDASAGPTAEAGAAESAVRQQAAAAAQPVATRSRAFTVDQATMKHHHRHHRRRRKRHRRHHRERSGAMRTHHHRTRARSATKHRVPRGTRTLKSTLKATQRRLAKLQSKLQVRWMVPCLQSVHRARARKWWPGDDRLSHIVQGVVDKGSRHFYNRPRITVGWEIVQEERKATWFELFYDLVFVACCINLGECGRLHAKLGIADKGKRGCRRLFEAQHLVSWCRSDRRYFHRSVSAVAGCPITQSFTLWACMDGRARTAMWFTWLQMLRYTTRIATKDAAHRVFNFLQSLAAMGMAAHIGDHPTGHFNTGFVASYVWLVAGGMCC